MASKKSSTDASHNITRKDFLNATLVGAGSLLLSAPAPLKGSQRILERLQKEDWNGYGGIGDYANANGNTWEVMSAAHGIRDGKYKSNESSETNEIYDLVVIGGGFSGLGAAYAFNKATKGQKKCLVLENHPVFGGEAKQNEFEVDGYKLFGPQGSNDFLPPSETDPFYELWTDLKLPFEYDFATWNSDIRAAKDNFGPMFFSEKSASVGYYHHEQNSWSVDPWEDQLRNTPWSEDFRDQMMKLRYNKVKPYDGPDIAKWLDSMTYQTFITDQLKLSPEVVKYVDPLLAVSAFALGADVISAFAALTISLPGVNVYAGGNAYKDLDIYSFPGGNSAIIRHLVKKMIPDSISGEQDFPGLSHGPINFSSLDNKNNSVRLRLNATATDVTHSGKGSEGDTVKVTFVKEGKQYTVTGKAVIIASGTGVARRICSDLTSRLKTAMSTFHHGPVLVANIALSNWKFMEKLGISAAHWFDGIGFFANLRLPMKMGEYSTPFAPDKPAVLTMYIPLAKPGHDIKTQATLSRNELFSTSFSTYEKMIRAQLNKMFGVSGFDDQRDIKGIILNRWGHAFVAPQPGFYFGKNGEKPATDIVREGYGRVRFAHSELRGHQNWIGAVLEGNRAAQQILSMI